MIISIFTIKENTTSFRFVPTKVVVVTADEVEDNTAKLVVLGCVLERLDVLEVVLSAARKTTNFYEFCLVFLQQCLDRC